MNFAINEMELVKFKGLTSKNYTIHTDIQIKRTKIGINYAWATDGNF